MENLLYYKDAYQPLSGTKPSTISDEDWKITNRKTIALIRQWIDDSVYHHISAEINTKTLRVCMSAKPLKIRPFTLKN
jgi:hypothetical protein